MAVIACPIFEPADQPHGRRASRARARRAELLKAACVAIGERGRNNVRVADVVAGANVSRNSFYGQFTSAEQCVEVALTQIDDCVRQVLDEALSETGTPAASRFEQAVSRLVSLAKQEPAAFRAWIADEFASAAGRRRIDEVRAQLEPPAREALSAGGAPMPHEMVGAIVGGVVLTLQTRATHEQIASLPTLLPELLGWALGYRAPSASLPHTAPAADKPQPSSSLRAPDAAPVRILQATTEAVAEQGYASVRVKEVAARAHVSLRTFYKHFDGLEQALLSAVESHEHQLLRAALEAYRDRPSWPLAVHAGLRSLCHGLAGEPHVARVCGVGTYEAVPATCERPTKILTALQAFLQPGHRHHPATRRFASEGVAAALAFTFYDHARTAQPQLIRAFAPTASFLALSPFLPVAQASRIAALREP